MDKPENFYLRPILNSPYEEPGRHWELDGERQPTGRILDWRRPADFITPVPKPKKKQFAAQASLFADATDIQAARISDADQEYQKALINEIRAHVRKWRALPKSQWKVSPTTARLLEYWRTHKFGAIRPFFCQLEAVETAIWLTEVVPHYPKLRERYGGRLIDAERAHNPGIPRLALKMATGSGKTTVMAMLIAWQTLNAVRSSSRKFTRGFLVVAPGITVRDRLRVLLPNDPDSYYRERDLVPPDTARDLNEAVVVIVNYHAFMLREKISLAAGTRAALEGWRGRPIASRETEGEMIHRVMPELERIRDIVVFNDEAHHCYREKIGSGEDDFAGLRGSELTEAKRDAAERGETARIWIGGLEAVARKIGIRRVFDLSATPFFLAGSGYAEGTIFPWTLSDFSLLDAIECGVAKLPRVPVADNIPTAEVPVYRELWAHIRDKMPKKGSKYDPEALPVPLLTALDALYGHYRATFESWRAKGLSVPPCFIIICSNTNASKQVFDYISGYWTTNDKGEKRFHPGKFPLFGNYEDDGEPLQRMRTLLIDSSQLEKGDILEGDFREAAREEIARFEFEIKRRHDRLARDLEKGKDLPDAAILREIMNTVGKKNRLGEAIRCVVSVGMLSEGWDANNVTHILGVRAFGTQLLCEQVVGRALRRQSYELNDKGLFEAEYADALGIPFDFSARPTIVTPQPPRETTHIRAVSPERDALEIRFPRIVGYRTELPSDILRAEFTEDSTLVLTPEMTGPAEVLNQGIFGEEASLDLKNLDGVRDKTVLMHLTKFLLERHFRDGDGEPRLYLYGRLKKIVLEWTRNYFRCERGTRPAQLLNRLLGEMACERVVAAIDKSRAASGGKILAIPDDYEPTGSTLNVNFKTTKTTLWRAAPDKCHINYAVCDRGWEAELCRILEKPESHVLSYVKNHNLGFEIPYSFAGENHMYRPDFIARVDRGDKEPINLVIEVKGERDEIDKTKKLTVLTKWLPGVNASGEYGIWDFIELKSLDRLESELIKAIARIRRGEKVKNAGGLLDA